jgi:uncharacterized membrane protein YjjP (DUF1212 family)
MKKQNSKEFSMDYYALMDLAITLGHRLAMSGAETFRVEDSMFLVLKAYGIEAEVFATTNYLSLSIKGQNGKPMTRMRRIGIHGNDLDAVERYSNLSRRLCAYTPDPAVAMEWLKEEDNVKRQYSLPAYYLGHFLGAAGFAIMFGSTFTDCLLSGVCGLIVGAVSLLMDKFKPNQFFRIIISAFLMALAAYLMKGLGLVQNADTVNIGALMLLVPGLLFTNALRDIINGDTNSGLNRVIQVFLIAIAIALGTGAALRLSSNLFYEPGEVSVQTYGMIPHMLAAYAGCAGFSIYFNIHGFGAQICNLGGVITWVVYLITLKLGGSDLAGYFWATVFASTYAEIMARVRKYPAISYLVVSIFPLIPGASVYYTMNYVVQGDMDSFASQGLHTIAIAGVIAVGILLASTVFRSWSLWRRSLKK